MSDIWAIESTCRPSLIMKIMILALKIKKKILIIDPYWNEQERNYCYHQVGGFEVVDENILHQYTEVKKFFSFSHEPFLIVFTSGSSGKKKAIVHSIVNIFYSVENFKSFFPMAYGLNFYLNLPLYHIGGIMVLWRAFFLSGNCYTDFIDNSIDCISLVPTQLFKIINGDLNNAIQLAQLKKIKIILIGGGELSLSLKKRASKLGLNLYETYGMTETCSLVCIDHRPLSHSQLSLDESDDQKILIKGKTLYLGYYEDGQFIKRTGEIFKTNDQGEFIATSLIKFKARLDFVFKSGGKKINPLEIEKKIIANEHAEFAITSIPDEKWGRMAVALTNNLALNLSMLNSFENPKFIFYSKFIPKLTNGKIDRIKLEEMAYHKYLKSIFHFRFIQNQEDAPTIVLLHGFLGEQDEMINLFTFDKNFNYLALDLPGHGKTSTKNFYHYLDFRNKLTQFLSLFQRPDYMIGYSLGGRLALQIQKDLPLKKLVLISAGFDNGINNQSPKFDGDLQEWYRQKLFSPFLEGPLLNKYLETKKEKINLLEILNSSSIISKEVMPTEDETLKNINPKLKILYLAGSHDKKYVNEGKKLKALAKMQIIEGAGHALHLTHTDECLRFIFQFFNDDKSDNGQGHKH